MHDDGMQSGDFAFDFAEEPLAEVFGGGVFEQGLVPFFSEVVEALVVEAVDVRLHDGFDVAEIHQDAGFRINRSGYFDGNAEAVPVHAAAFMSLGKGREEVRGFK